MAKNIIYIIFAPLAPSAPPQSPTGRAQSATVITLEWDPPPPSDINGEIGYYVVELIEVYTVQMWTFHAVEDYIHIGSLHPFYHYQYRIAAFTIQLGPFTNYSYVMTTEAGKFIFNWFLKVFSNNVFLKLQFQVEYHKTSWHYPLLHLRQSCRGHLLCMRSKMVSLLTILSI